MNEKDLLDLWGGARRHIIVSQLAPTFLLTVTIATLAVHGGHGAPLAVRLAAAGILLASGILGSIAQYTSASEARAIIADLARLENPSRIATQIIRSAWWTPIVRFVTPAIFVLIFLAILWQLFIAR